MGRKVYLAKLKLPIESDEGLSSRTVIYNAQAVFEKKMLHFFSTDFLPSTFAKNSYPCKKKTRKLPEKFIHWSKSFLVIGMLSTTFGNNCAQLAVS